MAILLGCDSVSLEFPTKHIFDSVTLGVGEGDRVAVRLPKGPGQVAAVLGVLAAGAAYVPVGVSQPEARAALILEQAGASLCVDSTELARLEAADPLPRPPAPPSARWPT